MNNDILRDNLINSQNFKDMLDKKEIIGELPILVEKCIFSDEIHYNKIYKFKFENENNNNIINQSNSENIFSQLANEVQNSNSHLNLSRDSDELNIKNEEPAKLYFGNKLLILYSLEKRVIIIANYKGKEYNSNLHSLEVKTVNNHEKLDIKKVTTKIEKIKEFCKNENNPKNIEIINNSNDNISEKNKPIPIYFKEQHNNNNKNNQKDKLEI